jgi:hypothetical protein
VVDEVDDDDARAATIETIATTIGCERARRLR